MTVKSILNKKQKAQQLRRELQNMAAAMKQRAASLTVGTAFGGSVEITMRNNDGTFMYAIMQPVEAIEFMHQIAAGIGCHMAVKPRDDFGSWRQWREVDAPAASYFSNHPPFAEGAENKQLIGVPEHQINHFTKEQNRETVAIEKPVKRSRAKRASAPA